MRIYLLDTETTGLNGYPSDVVVDIGIVLVDTGRMTVEDVYQSHLGYDVDSWPPEMRDAWVFRNTSLTVDDIRDARLADEVVEEVRDILRGQEVTSYNVDFDFGRFLSLPPWELGDICHIGRCVMEAARDYFKLPGFYGEYRYTRLEYSYANLVEGDPAGISGHQDHTALSDCRVAGHVLLALSRADSYGEAGQ